jgi:hypothetical protein
MSEQAERDFLALSALEIEQQGCLADARGPAAAAAAVPGAAAGGGACSSLPPSLVCALNAVHGCFVLSDPAQPDCPMVRRRRRRGGGAAALARATYRLFYFIFT